MQVVLAAIAHVVANAIWLPIHLLREGLFQPELDRDSLTRSELRQRPTSLQR